MTDPRKGLPSASSMARLAKCPGSLALKNSLRAEGRLYRLPNPYAPSGTKIHEAIAGHWQGQNSKDLSGEELWTASLCVELAKKVIDAWRGTDTAELEYLVEKRFWWRQGLRPRFSAQPDLVLINRASRRALDLNFKTGRLAADPEADNLQLRTEIVCLRQNEPQLEEIDGAIIEPLVDWENERVSYSAASLQEADNQILAIVDEAAWCPEARNAGPWCVDCPARANCPQARRYVENVSVPPGGQELLELPRGESGTLLWQKIQVAQKILTSLEEAYEQILTEEPAALPGLILPIQGKRRRIVPPFALKLKEALVDYLSPEQIDGCAEYSIAKIQELFGLKYNLKGVELARQFESLTRDCVAVLHDKPFIRPLTKRERLQAGTNVIEAKAAFTK